MKGLKGLMKDYFMYFLRMQICKNEPKSEEQCAVVNNDHKRIGFKVWKDISPEDTSNSPGLEQVAKLCLNRLWGKIAQISGLTTSKRFGNYFEIIHEMVRSDTLQIKDTIRLCENCVEAMYDESSDYTIDQAFINVTLAGSTTSNARLRLYNMLNWLDSPQVMYCDTDSGLFLDGENNPLHKSP